MAKSPREHGSPGAAGAGFTMIELIVVIAIIMMAAGMMAPSIADFFRNRQLSQVLSELRSNINSARLRAVNERNDVTLVFFREGVRIYDHHEGEFVDETFDPDNSPLRGEDSEEEGGEVTEPKTWYVLGFQDRILSTDLISYPKWEQTHVPRADGGGSGGSRRAAKRELDLSGLPRITFLRDGTVRHETGSDVMSTLYNQEPPVLADIMIYSSGNTSAGFIDLLMNGQNRAKMSVVTDYTATTPSAMKQYFHEVGFHGSASKEAAGRNGKRRSRR